MNKTCCPLYTIKCEALNFKPTKSQKKIVKKFVNYVLNDVRPGGGGGGGSSKKDGEGMEEASEDCGKNDHLQSQIENVENNLKMDIDVSNLPLENVPENRSNVNISSKDGIKNTEANSCDKDKSETLPKINKPNGIDPSKPRQVKAKLARLERYNQKHGANREPKIKNQEKSIEDLLEPLRNSSGSKHKWD